MQQTSRGAALLFAVGVVGLAGIGVFRGGSTGRAPAAGTRADDTPSFLSLTDWPTTAEIRRGRLGLRAELHRLPRRRAVRATARPPSGSSRRPATSSGLASSSGAHGRGQLPFEDDVFRTVTCGLPGSAMPGFPLVAEQQRRDVVTYVLDLAVFTQAKIVAEVLVERGRDDHGADPRGSARPPQEGDRGLARCPQARDPACLSRSSTPASVETGRVAVHEGVRELPRRRGARRRLVLVRAPRLAGRRDRPARLHLRRLPRGQRALRPLPAGCAPG